MVNKLQIHIGGKVFLYSINAYTDAYLTEELIKYYKCGKINNVKSARVKSLIKKAHKNKKLILGVAYCQYYWNGWYDYICAQILEKLFKNKVSFTKYQNQFNLKNPYKKINKNIFSLIYNLLWPLVFLFLGKTPNLNNFKKRFNVKKNIDKRTVVRACYLTQLQNIKHNNKLIKNIKRDKSKKAQYIRRFISQSQKKTALNSIQKTLKLASFWDQFFACFLKIRYFYFFKN